MPSRWAGRDSGAMKVYSMVPSQRSHATVSVTISNTSPRYDHSTAPISRMTSRVVDVDVAAAASTPLAMNTIVSVLATV